MKDVTSPKDSKIFYFLNYPVLFFLNSLCLLLPPSFQCYQLSTDNSMPVMPSV